MDRLKKERVLPTIRRALREDIGKGDITTESIVTESLAVEGKILLKERAVLSGLKIFDWVFNEIGDVDTEILVEEGDWLKPEASKTLDIIRFSGDAQSVLMGERVALNFVQRLSGISTLTREFVEKVRGTRVTILDTRKTTPTMRYLEKYAVKMGGGENHRMGLYDEVLIKENHISIAGGIKEALSKVKGEIEVRNFREVREAIDNGATHLLLDNMTPGELKKVVEMVGERDIRLEASGGIELDNIESYAETGIDYISIGALTHSYKSIDISLEID